MFPEAKHMGSPQGGDELGCCENTRMSRGQDRARQAHGLNTVSVTNTTLHAFPRLPSGHVAGLHFLALLQWGWVGGHSGQ